MLSENWRQATAGPRLRATLDYLWRLTRDPNDVDDAAVDAALAEGVSPGALEQATLMAVLFAYMNRMVDAFGADATPEEAETIAGLLDKAGGGAELMSRPRPWVRMAGKLPVEMVLQLDVVRSGDGDSPKALREAIEARVAGASGGQRDATVALPAPLERLVATLAADAHGVTDQHIDDLRPDWSEEAIYEMIFVASFAAGLGRMERSLGLLASR